MIHILFFGKLAEIAEQNIGNSELKFELPDGKNSIILADLRKAITKNAPDLFEELNKTSNLCALNQELCQDNQNAAIKNGDEVAFMSPLSGG